MKLKKANWDDNLMFRSLIGMIWKKHNNPWNLILMMNKEKKPRFVCKSNLEFQSE